MELPKELRLAGLSCLNDVDLAHVCSVIVECVGGVCGGEVEVGQVVVWKLDRVWHPSSEGILGMSTRDVTGWYGSTREPKLATCGCDEPGMNVRRVECKPLDGNDTSCIAARGDVAREDYTDCYDGGV